MKAIKLRFEAALAWLAVALLLGCGTLGEDGLPARGEEKEIEAEARFGAKQNRPFNYEFLEMSAYESNINFKYLEVKRPREKVNKKENHVDRTTVIDVAGKRDKQGFHSRDISRYIKNLESLADSIRVTAVMIKRISEGSDKWYFNLKVTDRWPLVGEDGLNTGTTPLPSVYPAWQAVLDTIEESGATESAFKLHSLKIETLCSVPALSMSGAVKSGNAMDGLIAALAEDPVFTYVGYPGLSTDKSGKYRFMDLKMEIAVD